MMEMALTSWYFNQRFVANDIFFSINNSFTWVAMVSTAKALAENI